MMWALMGIDPDERHIRVDRTERDGAERVHLYLGDLSILIEPAQAARLRDRLTEVLLEGSP